MYKFTYKGINVIYEGPDNHPDLIKELHNASVGFDQLKYMYGSKGYGVLNRPNWKIISNTAGKFIHLKLPYPVGPKEIPFIDPEVLPATEYWISYDIDDGNNNYLWGQLFGGEGKKIYPDIGPPDIDSIKISERNLPARSPIRYNDEEDLIPVLYVKHEDKAHLKEADFVTNYDKFTVDASYWRISAWWDPDIYYINYNRAIHYALVTTRLLISGSAYKTQDWTTPPLNGRWPLDLEDERINYDLPHSGYPPVPNYPGASLAAAGVTTIRTATIEDIPIGKYDAAWDFQNFIWGFGDTDCFVGLYYYHNQATNIDTVYLDLNKELLQIEAEITAYGGWDLNVRTAKRYDINGKYVFLINLFWDYPANPDDIDNTFKDQYYVIIFDKKSMTKEKLIKSEYTYLYAGSFYATEVEDKDGNKYYIDGKFRILKGRETVHTIIDK